MTVVWQPGPAIARAETGSAAVTEADDWAVERDVSAKAEKDR